ncbi:hypothetical protein [Streptomyces sediminimaris]|uniref:hypothetical protein n=1 Tax=Streptomyces sediminimaris TaxID=3383721 RepID=UPI00399B76C2
MQHTGSDDRARELREGLYRRALQAFGEGRLVVYGLRTPWQTPCALGEWHEVDGVWQSAMLVYGPWDTRRDHIRVTTWRELPGQDGRPETPADLATAPAQDVEARVSGHTVPAVLRRRDGVWHLETAVADHRIQVSGRGAMGDTTLESVADITPLVEARRTALARRRAQD